MEFQAYIPTKLHGLVTMIWEQKSGVPANWQILPSGQVELIFNIGPTLDVAGKRVGKGFNPTESFCFLSGIHTKSLYMAFPRFHVMGIQMHPLAVKTLFGIPCNEVKDWAILGEYILQDMNQIEDHLRSAGDFITKAKWLENYLLSKVKETNDLFLALKIKEVISKAKSQISDGKRVKLENLTGYSRMHTLRLFNDWFGLAPGQTLRLYQYIDAMNYIHDSSRNLSEIGFESGFYDQAHFIRVFREFTDMTPGDYKNRMSPLVGQLVY